MPVLHHSTHAAKAFACLLPGSSKGAVTRDGDNELAIQFIVITGLTNDVCSCKPPEQDSV